MSTYHEGQFYFNPDDLIYHDHFPGNKIVPGTIFIKSFLEVLKTVKDYKGLKIRKFRFSKFIRPGEYNYQIRINDDGVTRCTLLSENEFYCKGEIQCFH
jgi:3-hydroxyacyl-[acyl-carrier-protein] dehydratase